MTKIIIAGRKLGDDSVCKSLLIYRWDLMKPLFSSRRPAYVQGLLWPRDVVSFDKVTQEITRVD